MQTYKEVFVFYEETELHTNIAEVEEAEAKLNEQIKKMATLLNNTTIEELDSLIGNVVRSYEMQGFAFAQAVYDVKDGWVKVNPRVAESISNTVQKQAKPAKQPTDGRSAKVTNGISPKGVPCRYITSNGMTMNCGEWIEFLGCSYRSFYDKLHKGESCLDSWIAQRLAAKVNA